MKGAYGKGARPFAFEKVRQRALRKALWSARWRTRDLSLDLEIDYYAVKVYRAGAPITDWLHFEAAMRTLEALHAS